MKNINTFYRFGRNRNMGTIKTWEDVYNFLTKNGVNEQSLIKLVTNIDIENAHLFDIKIKLKGENYHSAFRSDFANAIKDTQDAVNNVVLLLTEGSIRNLTDKEKEQLMFYVKVEQGSTVLTIFLTVLAMNALINIINTPNKPRFYSILGAIILFGIVAYSPDILNSYSNIKDVDAQILKSQNEKDVKLVEIEDEFANKALKFLAESDQQLDEKKVALINEVLQQKEKLNNSIVMNSSDVEEIVVNDYMYDYHAIAKIKEEIDIPVRAKTKEITGEFYIRGILKKTDISVKLLLAPVDDLKAEFSSHYLFADDDNKDAILDTFYNALKEDTTLELDLRNEYNKNNILRKSSIISYTVKNITKL